MNVEERVHLRGWLDTRERIQQGLAADPYVSALFTRNANLMHLRDQSTDVISAAVTICCGTRYIVDRKPLPQSAYVISLAIGELMSHVLPEDMCLDVGDANEVFEEILDALMTTPNIYTRKYTTIDWITQLEAAAEEGEDAEGINIEVGERFREANIARLRAQLTGGLYDEVSAEYKTDYLVWLAVQLQPSQYLRTVALIVTSYVGVAKRGMISERFVDKIQTGMKSDLGVEVTISSDIIHQAYNMFGRYVTATNASDVFERWLGDIPEHALRLRLSLTQETGSGLTAFIVIGRAMTRYPTFNWAKLNLLTSGELACYRAAIATVAGNPYYGFNRDLGAARSTLYSSIAYVAKELLLQLNGETSLKNYKGWIRKPKSATTIDAMISEFVEESTRAMQQGEALL